MLNYELISLTDFCTIKLIDSKVMIIIIIIMHLYLPAPLLIEY